MRRGEEGWYRCLWLYSTHLSLKGCLVDGWVDGGGTRGKSNGQTWECTKCGKAEIYHFGTGRANGVFRGVAAVIVPRTSRATEVRGLCI
jgi:hypothetical protein